MALLLALLLVPLLCAEEYRQRHGADPESKLIRVQLKLDGETTEPHSLYGSSEILGPPLNSLISKTPLLSLLGTQKHVVVFPGGPAEMEQVATVLLGGQLNGMAHTIYHKDIQPPEVTFLCARVKKTEPFWHPLREQLEAMRKVGALRRKHLKHLNWDYKLAPEALTDSIWS